MGHDEHDKPEKASSCAAAPHQASTGATPPLSQEELLAGALAAFAQEADSAALKAQSSLSASPSPEGSAPCYKPEQQQQQPLQQASSLPDLSKGASPAREEPSQSTSEPGPQERQNSGVLRPTPQRIGLGDVNTGSLPLNPSASLRPTGSLKSLSSALPVISSNSLRGGSLGTQQAEQARAGAVDAAGTPGSPSWQPQGSAWKRYVAQAADAAAAPKGAPLSFGVSDSAQPKQPQPEAPMTSGHATGHAAGQQPEETSGPVANTPAAPAQAFPAQLSLDRLQAERRSSLQQKPDDAGQPGRDPMETLQAAASALFKQLIKPDGAQQAGKEQALLQPQGSMPEAFGSRVPSMASNFQEAAASFLEAARASAGQSPAPAPAQQAQQSQQAAQQAWQSMPYLQMLQSLNSRQLQSLSTISASPPPSAGHQTEAEKAPAPSAGFQKNWADAAAALLGPVAPHQQLTSAFSDALATRAGKSTHCQLSPLALPTDTMQPADKLQQLKASQADAVAAAALAPREDWATACFSSFKDSGSNFSLPISGWQLPNSTEGQMKSVSLPASTTSDTSLLKMHTSLLTGKGNMGSLLMPGTPSLPNLPSHASMSPPLSPQDSLTPLGRQLEMCLARQVHVQNVKRHGPLQVLMSDEQMAASAAAAAAGSPQRFGGAPWPHASQRSLDSQVSRMQLAQAALEKADMFKVPGNLASFLKQASLDTAMALLQQRETTPPTPVARQLAGQGGGAVWPFGAGGMPHQQALSQTCPSPDRLGALSLRSSPLRGMPGDMHGGEPHRLQASQQVFQDMGNSAINPQLTEAVLADSLYRSVTERLQSGAGPANFNQVGGLNYGAAEDATFYRMDSAAAQGGGPPSYAHLLGPGHYSQQQHDPQHHMMELLGLLRAGLVTPQDHMMGMGGGRRKRRGDSPGSWRKRRGDDGSGDHLDAPPPKRSANNKCEECGTTETPTWRRWGPTLLCNACGLRRKKNPKLQPPPKDAALPAEPPAQHSRDLSVQQSGEDVRSGDHSQLSHALAPPVHQ